VMGSKTGVPAGLPIQGFQSLQDPLLRTPIGLDLWKAVVCADRHRCVFPFCRQRRVQVDHARPRACGGSDRPRNLFTLCARHNKIKSNYWRDRDGYVHYRPFDGYNRRQLARAILTWEKLLAWNPARWLRLNRELRKRGLGWTG
jgi:hypothetical protein